MVIFWVTIIRGLKMSTDVQLRGSCDASCALDRHYYISVHAICTTLGIEGCDTEQRDKRCDCDMKC